MFDIQKAKDICEKATPGPWVINLRDGDAFVDTVDGQMVFGADWYDGPRLMCKENDERFVTEARTLLPEAIERLEALEELHKAVKAFMSHDMNEGGQFGFKAVHMVAMVKALEALEQPGVAKAV